MLELALARGGVFHPVGQNSPLRNCGKRRDRGVVDVEHHSRFGRQSGYRRPPDRRDRLDLAVAIKLVAE